MPALQKAMRVRYSYTVLSDVKPDVPEGQYVTPYTVIGSVGSSGNAA